VDAKRVIGSHISKKGMQCNGQAKKVLTYTRTTILSQLSNLFHCNIYIYVKIYWILQLFGIKMVYKKLHRKLKIEQHESHLKADGTLSVTTWVFRFCTMIVQNVWMLRTTILSQLSNLFHCNIYVKIYWRLQLFGIMNFLSMAVPGFVRWLYNTFDCTKYLNATKICRK
jgi:hypothetical protein